MFKILSNLQEKLKNPIWGISILHKPQGQSSGT